MPLNSRFSECLISGLKLDSCPNQRYYTENWEWWNNLGGEMDSPAFALTVWGTIVVYSILTFICHLMLLCSAVSVQLPWRQQLRLDFRAVRCFAGLQGILCFLYAVSPYHELGILGTNYWTEAVFMSYCGYLLFEVAVMAASSENVTDIFTKRSMQLLLFHHLLVGSGAYAIAGSPDGRMPHYLGMVMLGNEGVVISYGVIVIGRKFGYQSTRLVQLCTWSLPLQYACRQAVFMYISYSTCIHYTLIAEACSSVFAYCAIYIGLNGLTWLLNPYWLYETVLDARAMIKSTARKQVHEFEKRNQ